jgi:hypothetical protein
LQPLARDIFGRAVQFTLDAFGQTVATLVVAVLLAVGFWAIQCRKEKRRFFSLPADWRDGVRDILGVAAVYAVVLAVVFAVNVWRAISARDADREKTIADLQQAAQRPPLSDSAAEHALLKEISEKNSQLAELRAQVTTLTTALATSQTESAALRQQLSDARKAPAVVLGSGATLSREACDTIGGFVSEGQALLRETRKEAIPHPGPKVDEWAKRTEAFLRATLGDGSVGLFRNRSGLPMGVTSLQSREHQNIEGFLETRLARLQQFAQKCF